MLQRAMGAVGGGEAAVAQRVAIAGRRAGAAAPFGKIIVRSVARDLRRRPLARRTRHRLRDHGGWIGGDGYAGVRHDGEVGPLPRAFKGPIWGGRGAFGTYQTGLAPDSAGCREIGLTRCLISPDEIIFALQSRT
jgi:hypothetical protein